MTGFELYLDANALRILNRLRQRWGFDTLEEALSFALAVLDVESTVIDAITRRDGITAREARLKRARTDAFQAKAWLHLCQ